MNGFEINKEMLQEILNTFPCKTDEYGNSYMFFNSIAEFEKSLKFISVNGSPFRKPQETTEKEHARKYLYKTFMGNFVLISDDAWKKMNYNLINGKPVKNPSLSQKI